MSAAEKLDDSQTTQPAQEGEQIQFSAEISKVLQLMIHSLYTNKDIFLRELISNASDACDKVRYEAVSDGSLLDGDAELAIHLSADKEANTLTISDNGIGMNRADLIANLGTIAKSGTQEFFTHLSGDNAKDMNLIGQFGVGFYASYMVADKVVVQSTKAGEAQGYQWESDGQGSFSVSEAADAPARGTRITLHLKEEAGEYADPFRLRHIAQTYSDHITFPIFLNSTDAEGNASEEQVNKGSALWVRNKSEVSAEEYKEFYAHVAHQPDEPWMTLHNRLEGKIEYSYLLFIPSMKPFDLLHPERRRRVKLYVKRVFISDENVDLVPEYLRFMRGVIDSEDLPLNISRETLQDNPLMTKIRESVTGRVLKELAKKNAKQPEEYAEFWQHFGGVLKEGLCEGMAPREQILECCRFHSTHGGMVTLAEYAERMKDDQKGIYFIVGDSIEALEHSPQIEGFKKRGIEVLLLNDHVDDFWPTTTRKYKEHEFKSVVKHGADLGEMAGAKDADSDEKKDEVNTDSAAMDALTAYMKETLGDSVREVRVTHKLADSPVCLAVDEGDMDMRMERFLIDHKQLPQGTSKILEINPDHAIIKGLAEQVASEKMNVESEDRVHLLFDQARIAEGEALDNPSAFLRRMNALMGN